VIKAEWSSRSLFSQSLGLLRDHPVLALPVIFADILGLATRHDVVRAIRTPILNWLLHLSERDSVLSSSRGMLVMSTEHTYWVASVIGATLEWGSYFIKIFLYSGALFITSEWLRGIQAGDGPALPNLRGQLRKLARLSFVVLGGVMLTGFLFSLLFAVWISALAGRFDLGMTTAYGILLEVPLAYFIARPGLMLVWKKKDLPGPTTVRLARIFAMGTVVAQFLIALLIDRVVFRAINPTFAQMNGGELLVRNAIVSVAGAVPFIVLFIVLSVLGAEDVQSSETLGAEAAANS
jgi:CBS domain-containing protein